MAVIKVLELVGSSTKDWQDAANNAVMEASKLVPSIKGVEVINWTANVSAGKINEYRANVKVAYQGDESPVGTKM
ncbi:MAG TPA: dodecin domain-containing protein [Firmicutes bacterium]|nr:dodecin domain-containing protein [Bacillota bacterium]